MSKYGTQGKRLLGLSAGVLFAFGLSAPIRAADDAKVITLTQTGCQFLESEGGKDLGFTPTSAEDCKKINTATGDKRLSEAKPLVLAPGKYTFRVTNADVPYELGFWLRGTGLGRVTLPSVSGGGLTRGVTRDYVVDLKPGNYVYSCPLNPTPDYALIVKG
jgi:hypothetical protein